MSMRYPGGLIAPTPVNQQFPSGVWTGAQTTPYQVNNVWGSDPFFRNTTLLLHGDGANAAQNNTILDSSANNYTITRAGTITQGSFTPYNPGYYSNYFDGTGDYLTAPSGAAVSGTGAFTVEFWVFMTASQTYSRIVSGAANNITINLSSNGDFDYGKNGVNSIITANGGSILNTWAHVCVARSAGGTARVWVNGTSIGTATDSNSYTAATVYIGATSVPSFYLTGYLSNLRTTNTDVYGTSNTTITVPKAPLTAVSGTSLLTCQSNRFIDNSTNAFAITKNGDTSVQGFQPFPPSLQYTSASFSGSGYFFGASNSLTTPSGTCPVINNFSASGWVYRTSVPGYQQTFVALGIDGSGRVGFFWTGSNFEYNIYGSSTVTIDGSGAMPVGAWTYVVLTRTSSSLTLYYNGTLIATVSLGTAFSASSGRSMAWLDGTIGYATNLRFDTAAYSTPTVVPTAPISTTANTNNLLNFTNAGIFDNAMQNNLVTVGDAKINTSIVKYGTGSMYFDGSGDYLSAPASPNFIFGTGDFTVEFWVQEITSWNPAGGANYAHWISLNSYTTGVMIRPNTTGTAVEVWVGSTQYTFTTTLSLGIWYHIAVSRSSSSMRLFVNGIQIGSTQTVSYNISTNTANTIGTAVHSTTEVMQGYMDDLRITKGVARYVGNFTPPVARMPNQ